jgi:Stigma-specific protein, Stig1
MRPAHLALILVLGCSQTPAAPIRKPDCVTGAMAACLCEGDRQGWQTCGADRRLGACVCGDGGATATPLPMCLDPFALCNGRCANLLVDQEHCGRCGTACPAGQICFNASCAQLADAGGGGAVDVATDVPKADVIADDAPTFPDVAPADGADDVVSGDAGEGLDASDGAVPDDRPMGDDAPVFDAAMGMDP